jgi:hypothetical protein
MLTKQYFAASNTTDSAKFACGRARSVHNLQGHDRRRTKQDVGAP